VKGVERRFCAAAWALMADTIGDDANLEARVQSHGIDARLGNE
jgi:hypothetical protein